MLRNILNATAVAAGAALYLAACWCLVALAGIGGNLAAVALGADRGGAAFGGASAGALMLLAIIWGLIVFAGRSDNATHGANDGKN